MIWGGIVEAVDELEFLPISGTNFVNRAVFTCGENDVAFLKRVCTVANGFRANDLGIIDQYFFAHT